MFAWRSCRGWYSPSFGAPVYLCDYHSPVIHSGGGGGGGHGSALSDNALLTPMVYHMGSLAIPDINPNPCTPNPRLRFYIF